MARRNARKERQAILDPDSLLGLLPFIAVGFAAQLIDGALGMAYGTINTAFLIGALGLPPAAASASVHAAETFTTAASGLSHAYHRNIDWKLFPRLLIPGVVGGVLGAYVLSSMNARVAQPFVMAYLVAIGLYLLYRAWHGPGEPAVPRVVEPLGFAGGFLDAAGGGGWGAIVTSNLLVQGAQPRKTVGTVSATEFFLTATVSATFIATLGWQAFTFATVGLLIGGVAAAPFGAMLVKRVPARQLMAFVGILLVATSAASIWNALS